MQSLVSLSCLLFAGLAHAGVAARVNSSAKVCTRGDTVCSSGNDHYLLVCDEEGFGWITTKDCGCDGCCVRDTNTDSYNCTPARSDSGAHLPNTLTKDETSNCPRGETKCNGRWLLECDEEGFDWIKTKDCGCDECCVKNNITGSFNCKGFDYLIAHSVNNSKHDNTLDKDDVATCPRGETKCSRDRRYLEECDEEGMDWIITRDCGCEDCCVTDKHTGKSHCKNTAKLARGTENASCTPGGNMCNGSDFMVCTTQSQ